MLFDSRVNIILLLFSGKLEYSDKKCRSVNDRLVGWSTRAMNRCPDCSEQSCIIIPCSFLTLASELWIHGYLKDL